MVCGRAALRWSCGLVGQAVYCMHLFEVGELGLLRYVLQSIPGIEDGGAGLATMR